jgi:glucokinase
MSYNPAYRSVLAGSMIQSRRGDKVETYSIGVDLGGTNLRVASFDRNNGIRDSIELSTRRQNGRDAIICDLCDAVESLIQKFAGRQECVGIGVATPGPMELPEGRLLDPPNLPGWENFELRQTLERRLKRTVIVENDANVAALAECLLGQGKELKFNSLCMLTLGTGVGCGMILDGRIWHGMNGMAGESGHVSVDPEGPLCACGTRGCLELSASATGLVRQAGERIVLNPESGLGVNLRQKPDFTATDLFDLANEGDATAIQIFEAQGRALGRGLASLVNSLNLPLYVLGGGVAAGWELFAPKMFEELIKGSSIYRLTNPQRVASEYMAKANTHIVPAKLGSNSGILGACLVPFGADSSTSATAASSVGQYEFV